jgi:hypothetical protein
VMPVLRVAPKAVGGLQYRHTTPAFSNFYRNKYIARARKGKVKVSLCSFKHDAVKAQRMWWYSSMYT